jgi:hypothetical protein
MNHELIMQGYAEVADVSMEKVAEKMEYIPIVSQ